MLRVLTFLAALLLTAAFAMAEGPCAPMSFGSGSYTVCRFDLRSSPLALYDLDETGEPYGSFSALAASLASSGKTLSFAMNAGMYDDAQKPIGLYVEDGRQLKKVNRRSGAGNFHLKPNGIFWIDGSKGGVTETEAFISSGLKPRYATQSGPMLVIDGEIHPKFSTEGTSMKIRNGVGAVDGHTIVFAISESPVTFHDFADLFRDGLGCRNALFLDGSVSSLYDAATSRNDRFMPLGPIVGLAR